MEQHYPIRKRFILNNWQTLKNFVRLDLKKKNNFLPLIPRCPFILRPTEGDTKADGRSGRMEDLFSKTGGVVSTMLSDQTASTIESMLDDFGSLLKFSLLKLEMINTIAGKRWD